MSDVSATRRTIEAVWSIEAGKLVAGLMRTVRDIGLAEELAQDAFVAALQQWPEEGTPENPGAWLMAAAKRRAIDRVRRDRRFGAIREELARRPATGEGATSAPDPDARLDGEVEDDLLRLIFMACHPALSREASAALTLRLVCGLTTSEIARAFLVPEPTIAQRIVRAKHTLKQKEVAFEAPRGDDLRDRLASVLAVVYLLFNEGYAATAGDSWMRPALCEEAMRLGRILAALMPREAEIHGLTALMEIQASRSRARVDAAGRPVLLMDQDRSLWDRLLIRRGLAGLETARHLGGAPGPYALQAEIAGCHARARSGAETDWTRIADLYADLFTLIPTPVIALNRGVAIGMARGPQAGLDFIDTLTAEPALAEYHLLPSVRGEFLFRLGRKDEARHEFERAASLTRNARERELLLERARSCGAAGEQRPGPSAPTTG